ncbi:hypothetical protein MVUOKPPV_CDS0058 [Klebsiella phage phi1_175008]|uniref:Uncharacterized protein n=2 Tax=Klebsiella phage phi1_175008 TaxID=3127744 RepID=A0AC61ZSZ4_9CAUD
MIMIGSRALEMQLKRQDKELYRSCVDLDYLCTEKEWLIQSVIHAHDELVELVERTGNKGHVKMVAGAHIEFDIAQPGDSTDLLIQYCKANPQSLFLNNGDFVAPVDVLYLLKMSHRYKKNSPHFFKTMNDIHFMRSLGAKIPPELEEVFKLREKETYNYSHPNLDVKSKDFFKGDEVPYVYDHDTIHEAVAVLGVPAYKSYMKDDSEVMTSKEKFFEQENHIRLLGVYEESCVLALERSQIPFNFEVPARQSFVMALSKVCTSITSGYFREYAWESFHIVMKFYESIGEDDYIKRFKANQHLVKPFKG